MSSFKNVVKCCCCRSDFQFGPHVYDGRKVRGYEILVCRSCYDGNWDGWSPVHERSILASLSDRGIAPPPRNANGWLPREWPSGDSSGGVGAG